MRLQPGCSVVTGPADPLLQRRTTRGLTFHRQEPWFFSKAWLFRESNGLKALAPERGTAVSLRDQQQPVLSRPFSLDLNRSPDKNFPTFCWLSRSKISPSSVTGSK